MFELIVYDTANRVATITLNRPEKRNAFSPQLVAELKEAFAAAEADDSVRVVVLAANGPAFSAGADLAYLQALQSNSYEENLEDSESLMALYRQIYMLDKPVIARVQGHAIAGGCGLATVCDFVLAVPEANFGYTEVRIGFIPAIVMVFLLQRISGRAARELLLTGKLIPAETAQQYGLVNKVIRAEDLDGAVEQLAKELAETTSPSAVRMTRQMLGQISDMSMDEALYFAAEMNAKARETDDCRKGIDAFLNKQKPEW
ncbi:MAG: enoyl-CoA hydratase-related protein [Chitinophagales bacterium]|nr:enoyl-CoA hydratase-related protein [Chitinophagales bacterium]HRX24363.1 enoyl-CoA hydratase-related protein [Chitinophagales bacterium]